MSEIKDALARIRKFFKKHPEVPVGRFAASANLHRNSLYRMHSSDWNPTVETVEKCLQEIERFDLGVTPLVEVQGRAPRKRRKNPSQAAA